MVNADRIIKLFMEMVEVSSISGQEGAFRDYLKRYFSDRGLQCEEDDAGRLLGGDSGNLLIRITGTLDTRPILFLNHMDTVVPGLGIKAVLGDDGVIRSDGSTILGSDDKAGVAAVLEAYEILIEKGLDYPPLELLFTVSEEQGLLGAKSFDYSQLKAPIAYALDSGGAPGTIVCKSPSQNEIEYRVTGKAAHAGINPEEGINAIQLMSKALAIMPCGRIDEASTCNFGTIIGGTARNIVAAKCTVKGEARSLSRAELDRLTGELTGTFIREVEKNGGRAEVEVKLLYPEITLDAEEEVVRLAVAAAESIGLEAKLISTGGGSDASIVNGNNIRCANLGIGMNAVHTTEEFIRVEDLIHDAELVLAIIQQSIDFQEG